MQKPKINTQAKSQETEKKKTENVRKAYAELQKSKDELVRSEKLAFTGRIAASIAHEIRNPLTNVAMSIQQLKKAIKPEEPKAKHIEIVGRNIERINYLITELLNCARPPKLNLQPHNIHKVLRDTLDSSKAKIKSQKIKLVRKFILKSPQIIVDKEQMGRCFLNIILNAIDAMPKGGKLTIITELDKDFYLVKIQDTGKGILEEDVIRIFDPFFSTKPDGVGLGLALSYGIVVSHGGTIEVESILGRGSAFTVSLPIEQRLTRAQRERKISGDGATRRL